MDLGLRGRVAVGAAASKGLGRAVAEELAREGAHVAICTRTSETLAETAAQIQKSAGREVFHQALDVTDSAAVASFVAAVEARFGRLDICVTNSGGPPSNSFKNTKPEDWRSAVEHLLMSAVFFARETLPRMQKNKWGRLIVITSSAVKQPVDGLLLSNSVRAAVTGLARTLANEYAADGITVNNVCPGYTRTARLDGLASTISARTGAKPEEVFAGWEREIPAPWHAARIRRRGRRGRFSCFRARQLRYGDLYCRGRWPRQELALNEMTTPPSRICFSSEVHRS